MPIYPRVSRTALLPLARTSAPVSSMEIKQIPTGIWVRMCSRLNPRTIFEEGARCTRLPFHFGSSLIPVLP